MAEQQACTWLTGPCLVSLKLMPSLTDESDCPHLRPWRAHPVLRDISGIESAETHLSFPLYSPAQSRTTVPTCSLPGSREPTWPLRTPPCHFPRGPKASFGISLGALRPSPAIFSGLLGIHMIPCQVFPGCLLGSCKPCFIVLLKHG